MVFPRCLRPRERKAVSDTVDWGPRPHWLGRGAAGSRASRESDPEQFVKMGQCLVGTGVSGEREAETSGGKFGVEMAVQGERGVWL